MLGSEPDFLPETVIGFPGSQPGKAFLTRDFSVLCAPASWCCTWFSVAQGASWNGNDCRTVLSPSEEGLGEGKHCREVFYVICGFSVFCARLIFCVMPGMDRGRPVAAAPCTPGSGQQNRRYAVPSTYPCRLRVGPRQRPCKTRPSARIHAGCPGLPGTSQRF
jgi:hypothetical protein